ncbi:MAG TPA: hypothetical protein PKK15_22235 [Kouleothrix sp.]|nr:hypothetical protein [Kouleothrix sp.]
MGNPNYRNFGLADAKFQVASATQSATTQASADTITKAAHGLSNGAQVVFQSITTTTGFSTFTRYYVVGATTNTFQISATYGGSAIDLTGSDGSATYKAITEYDVLLANTATITPRSKEFAYAGDDTELARTQILGYTVELDADCIPLATHMGLFGLSNVASGLPDSYTGAVYGGTTTERAGVSCGLWFEGTATRVDASTGAETNVTLRRWFPLGTVSGVTPGGQKTGDKAEVEKYMFTASKTGVDVCGGALPSVPGAVFFVTLEK